MSDTPERVDQTNEVDTDLVGYLIVVIPGVESLADLTPALVELVRASMIRLLDVVVVVRDLDGTVSVLEFEEIEGVSTDALGDFPGGLFSEHDLELASLAIAPGAAGVVLVMEDRWAEPLSTAAQRIGGRIIAGERIPARRARRFSDGRRRPDLLARPPCGSLVVDPVEQLKELVDLRDKGLLSGDEFERQKARMLLDESAR